MTDEPQQDECLPATSLTDNKNVLLLHWAVSTILLSLGCMLVGWMSAKSAVPGQSFDDPFATGLTLVFILGLIPFYMRHHYSFSLSGLLIIVCVGVGLVAFGWLIGFNMVIFAWLGMTWLLSVLAKPTAWGRMITLQIEREKTQQKSWLNPPTEQKERLLFVYDFLTVLLIILLLLILHWAVSSLFFKF